VEKPVEIEILGHKAKIVRVQGEIADGVWYKEDAFVVQIQCDEGQGFGSTIGFFVELPVKEYGSQEFIQAVIMVAEKKVPEMMARDEKAQEKREAERKRENELHSLASQIETILQERRLL
jgi:hypothetical protein